MKSSYGIVKPGCLAGAWWVALSFGFLKMVGCTSHLESLEAEASVSSGGASLQL